MNQNKTISSLRWILLFGLSVLAFACAPKKQGVRASVKTGSTSLNPNSAAIAEQQAAAQNAIYKISTVSLPSATSYGVVVNSDLLNPSSQYLPISTTHSSGAMYTEGIFNDTSRNLQVHVNATCSDMDCTRYMLLVTTVRNNQAIFQSGAISYKDDCNFYSYSASNQAGQMFQSMDAFVSRYASLQPIGDSTSCLQ